MIPIKNSNLDSLAKAHLEAIHLHLKNSRTKYTYDDINSWFVTNGLCISFEDVILANANELGNIKVAYSSSAITDEINYIRDTLYSSYFANSSKYLIDTDYNAATLVKELKIKVCPYCNRNFINNVTYANRGLKRTSQIDHFHSKEKYPFLAMSFYNLIPSCPSCNHIKSNKSIDYSPYDERFSAGDLLRFDYNIMSSDYVYDENHIEIKLTPKTSHMISNIETFRIESQYEIHKDIVQELIKKKLMYTDLKLQEIQKDFSDLFPNEENMKRNLFGNYLGENDFHKRPLSKLMSDIYNQVDNN